MEEWNILWPFSAILPVFFVKLRNDFIKSPIFINIVWIVLYMLFLLVVPVAPRYLLLLIPFLYNVAIWALSKSIDTRS